MEYLIGLVVAVCVWVFALLSGFDRDRAFYPTVLIVVAAYYILYAAMGGSRSALLMESLVAFAFATLAVTGFKWNPWLVVAALLLVRRSPSR